MADGLNGARKSLLRKLFLKRDKLQKELDTINQSIQTLGGEYWREAGHLVRPRDERLRAEIFRGER